MQETSRTKLIEQSEGLATKLASLDITQRPTPFVDRSLTKTTAWSYFDVASIKRLIATAELTSEEVAGKSLWSFNFDPDTVTSLFASELGTHFGLFSAKLNFEIQIQSHFTQLGALLVTYSNAPDSVKTIFGTAGAESNPFTKFRLPNDVITLGKSMSHLYSMDWILPIKNWPTQSEKTNAGAAAFKNYLNSHGVLDLSVLVPLTSLNALPVTVRVYAHLTDLEYSLWIP